MGIAFEKMIAFVNGEQWRATYPNTTYEIEVNKEGRFLEEEKFLIVANPSFLLVMVEVNDFLLEVRNDATTLLDTAVMKAFVAFWFDYAPDLYLATHERKLIAVPARGEPLRAYVDHGIEDGKCAYYKEFPLSERNGRFGFQIEKASPYPSEFHYMMTYHKGDWHLKKEYSKRLNEQKVLVASVIVKTSDEVHQINEKARHYRRLEQNRLVSVMQWFEKKGLKTYSHISYFAVPIGGVRLSICLHYCELDDKCYLLTAKNEHMLTNRYFDDRIYNVETHQLNGNPVLPKDFLKEMEQLRKIGRLKTRLV